MAPRKKIELNVETLTANNIIPALHQALDQYEVQVYNGQQELSSKPLKEAITYISSDVRKVKDNSIEISTILSEHKELLQNIKDRKRFKQQALSGFKGIYDYMNTHSWFRIL